MKNEIDKDFYCSANRYRPEKPAYDRCGGTEGCYYQSDTCPHRHRKFPTPEQYREEYGEEVPDNMPVWYSWLDTWLENSKWSDWEIMLYKTAKEILQRVISTGNRRSRIVVACTPFVPNKDWRPE